jgi:hypothetical protein
VGGGLAYSIVTILMKLEPNPICSKTIQRYDHSSLSKAISVLIDRTAQGDLVSDEACKIYNRRRLMERDLAFQQAGFLFKRTQSGLVWNYNQRWTILYRKG